MNDRDREERLNRLLRTAGTPPALEPDPYLPARIRALSRERATGRREIPVFAARWVYLSLGGAALALAIVAGGYMGYRAGASRSAGGQVEFAAAELGDEVAVDVFVDAWSQAGFADDLRQWNSSPEVLQ